MDRFIWIDGDLVNVAHIARVDPRTGGKCALYAATDVLLGEYPVSVAKLCAILRNAGAVVHDADDTLSERPR